MAFPCITQNAEAIKKSSKFDQYLNFLSCLKKWQIGEKYLQLIFQTIDFSNKEVLQTITSPQTNRKNKEYEQIPH